MRTEALINEAKGFAKDKSAYIHIEMLDGKSGAAIVSGDEKAVMVAIFSLIQAFAQKRAGKDATFSEMKKEVALCFKSLKKLNKVMLKVGRGVFDQTLMEIDEEER